MDIYFKSKRNRDTDSKAIVSRMLQATIICRALVEGGDSLDAHIDSNGFVDAHIFNPGTNTYHQTLINPVQANCDCRLIFKYPAAKSYVLLDKMRRCKENWFSVTLGDLGADELYPVDILVDSKETADKVIEQVFDADARNIEFHPSRFAIGAAIQYDGPM